MGQPFTIHARSITTQRLFMSKLKCCLGKGRYAAAVHAFPMSISEHNAHRCSTAPRWGPVLAWGSVAGSPRYLERCSKHTTLAAPCSGATRSVMNQHNCSIHGCVQSSAPSKPLKWLYALIVKEKTQAVLEKRTQTRRLRLHRTSAARECRSLAKSRGQSQGRSGS